MTLPPKLCSSDKVSRLVNLWSRDVVDAPNLNLFPLARIDELVTDKKDMGFVSKGVSKPS